MIFASFHQGKEEINNMRFLCLFIKHTTRVLLCIKTKKNDNLSVIPESLYRESISLILHHVSCILYPLSCILHHVF